MLEEQRELARQALAIVGDRGFALAGSSAVREHGLTIRPTRDVDLFAPPQAEEAFPCAVDELVTGMERLGYKVEIARRTNAYLSACLTKNDVSIELDMGIDYRTYPPACLSIGPVLDVKDAVANKVCAVFSRGEARDYLDLDTIRQSGTFTDKQLIELAAANDPGLTIELFAESLLRASFVTPYEVEPYGVSPEELSQVSDRLEAWGENLFADSNPSAMPTPSEQ